jgi:hypothetical protein
VGRVAALIARFPDADVPGAPGPMQDFSRHPEYFDALASFPAVDNYTRGTRLELGDFDAARGDDKFKLRAFGDVRLPIETPYLDAFLWKNTANNKYYISLVNRLNPRDPNSPAHLEISFMAARFTISDTSCPSRQVSATVRDGTRSCVTT